MLQACSSPRRVGSEVASLTGVTLRYCPDPGPADWITGAGIDWERLVTFGPPGFAGYARLRLIPDPTRPGQQEADNQLPEDHRSDLEQIRRAIDLLRPFAATGEDGYFGVWDGWGGWGGTDFPVAGRRGPLVEVYPGRPYRSYVLLRGSLADLDQWTEVFGSSGPPLPAFVWSADRSWCLAKDVDPHWAGIGASQAAMAALLGDPVLDVVPAEPDQPQPTYY